MKEKNKKPRGIISTIFWGLILVFVINNAINVFKREVGYLMEEQQARSAVDKNKTIVDEVKKQAPKKDINKSADKSQAKSAKELEQELVNFNAEMKKEFNKTQQATKKSIEKIDNSKKETDSIDKNKEDVMDLLPKLESMKDATNYYKKGHLHWERRFNNDGTPVVAKNGDEVDPLTGNVIQKADKNDTTVQFLELDKNENPTIKDK